MFVRIALPLVLLLVGYPGFCQSVDIRPISGPELRSPPPTIRASANLVLVPVHVTNRAGGAVTGLSEDVFSVFEDKSKQRIISFGSEDVPCSVGVVLDLSGSMSGKLSVATKALHAFLEAANPDDEAFLLTVSTRPAEVSGFTTDFGLLESRLPFATAGGATALTDTIRLGLDRMRGARYSRKALLVISDGMDNHSRYSGNELIRALEEADVQAYTIGVQTWSPFKKPIELTEERAGLAFLRELAERSGGLNWTINNLADAPEAAAQASQAIREQYLIGYTPPVTNYSGKWRSIQVKVSVPNAHVAARTGYYSR